MTSCSTLSSIQSTCRESAVPNIQWKPAYMSFVEVEKEGDHSVVGDSEVEGIPC